MAGRRASPYLWLDGAEEKTMNAISGEKFSGLSPTLCRVFASLRMYLASFPLPPMRFVRNWSASATASGYAVLKLRLSERRTGDREYFLWRTADANCARGAQSPERFAESQRQGRLLTLNDQVAHLWPTPKAGDAIIGMTARISGRTLEKSGHLGTQVYCAEMFPTPRASDADKGQKTPDGIDVKRQLK
jgi:hypothetical protein